MKANRDAIALVYAAYELGMLLDSCPNSNIDAKFNSEYIREMSKSLSLRDIATLMNATKIRESALSELRQNNLSRGYDLLNEARIIYKANLESEEAQLLAESFQYPADAFYEYKIENYLKAENSLLIAIGLCNVISSKYSYNFEVRKVHLARNIMRVLSKSGEYYRACEIGCQLIDLLDKDSNAIAYHDMIITTVKAITVEEKWFLYDQILEEISIIFNGNQSTISESRLLLRFCGDDYKFLDEFERIQYCIGAIVAFSAKDVKKFATLSTCFFKEGVQCLPLTWKKMYNMCKLISIENDEKI